MNDFLNVLSVSAGVFTTDDKENIKWGYIHHIRPILVNNEMTTGFQVSKAKFQVEDAFYSTFITKLRQEISTIKEGDFTKKIGFQMGFKVDSKTGQDLIIITGFAKQ
jgi:hypothetical protein